MKNAYFSDDPLHEHADSASYPALAGIIAVHALLLASLLWLQHVSDPVRVDILSVRLLQASPPVEAPVKPVPVKPVPQPLPKPKPVIQRVLTEKPVAAPAPSRSRCP